MYYKKYVKKALVDTIIKRRSIALFIYSERRESLMKEFTERKKEGKRQKGIPRMGMLDETLKGRNGVDLRREGPRIETQVLDAMYLPFGRELT